MWKGHVKTAIRVIYSTIEYGEREREKETANRRAATSYWQQSDHICGAREVRRGAGLWGQFAAGNFDLFAKSFVMHYISERER